MESQPIHGSIDGTAEQVTDGSPDDHRAERAADRPTPDHGAAARRSAAAPAQLALLEIEVSTPRSSRRRSRAGRAELERHRRHLDEARAIVRAARARVRERELAAREAQVRHLAEVRRRVETSGRGGPDTPGRAPRGLHRHLTPAA